MTVDPELEAVILQCMQKDPDARPQTGSALRASLLPIAAKSWDGERARLWWEKHRPLPRSTQVSDATREGAHARFVPASGQHVTLGEPLTQTLPDGSPTTGEIVGEAVKVAEPS